MNEAALYDIWVSLRRLREFGVPIEGSLFRNLILLLKSKSPTQGAIARVLAEDAGVSTERLFPVEYRCPIGGELMIEPVIDRYGHTYEESNITHWLNENNVSPLNRQPLSRKELYPNRILKNLIDNHLAHLATILELAQHF